MVQQIEFGTAVGRAVKLRCPRCGRGKLFRGLLRMNEQCENCGFRYERGPGYFLGSAYINYAVTAVLLTLGYVVLHFGLRMSNRALLAPLVVFCVLFPLVFFRYARSLWLAMDCYFDRSNLE